MTAREMSSNHWKGKGELEKSKTGDREDLKKNHVLSAENKDIERLIVQRSS